MNRRGMFTGGWATDFSWLKKALLLSILARQEEARAAPVGLGDDPKGVQRADIVGAEDAVVSAHGQLILALVCDPELAPVTREMPVQVFSGGRVVPLQQINSTRRRHDSARQEPPVVHQAVPPHRLHGMATLRSLTSPVFLLTNSCLTYTIPPEQTSHPTSSCWVTVPAERDGWASRQSTQQASACLQPTLVRWWSGHEHDQSPGWTVYTAPDEVRLLTKNLHRPAALRRARTICMRGRPAKCAVMMCSARLIFASRCGRFSRRRLISSSIRATMSSRRVGGVGAGCATLSLATSVNLLVVHASGGLQSSPGLRLSPWGD